LTESGALSQPFKLGKGHAQGDSPSPLLFNFAQQIMLFKIELSPDIKKIRIPEPLPKIYNPEKFFEAESNNETEVCDGFADDNYSLTSDDIENLSILEKYLKEFELLTGLGCNIDKTSLFLLGKAEPIPTKFAITSTVKILGITIKSGEPVNVTNYNLVWEKIGKIMNYWSRFGLSMLGRITVIKTLILPHLSFIGCILEPPPTWLEKVTAKIEKFVLYRENYAKGRIYLPAGEGGLGLINIENFLLAQQAAWLKKAMYSTNDNWKYDMRLCTNNFNILDRPDNPRLVNKTLIGAGYKLQQKLAVIGNNFLKVPVLNKSLFGTGRNLVNKLDDNFFESKLKITGTGKWNLTWKNLVDEATNFKPKADLDNFFGNRISDESYEFLRNAFVIAKKKYFKENFDIVDKLLTVQYNIEQGLTMLVESRT
jgi:hypothetical protein